MIKKFVSVALALLLLSLNIHAEEYQNKNTDDKITSEAEEIAEPSLNAQSPYVILMDSKTGSVLYEKNSSERVYPAGLTTIMTALLALENGNLEDVVKVKESSLAELGDGDSRLGIIAGERLSVRQLIYAMMLSSASDAANALAEYVSGSVDEFVKEMNRRAKALGMKNTNFTNATGAHDERHFTTPYDMALLSRYAMQIQEFCDIVKCESYSIPATEMCDRERKVTNKNYFVTTLLRNDYYYKYSTGIKTGYTLEAKSCIAETAEKNSMSLLCLIFGADTVDGQVQSFVDCKNLFDFVFDNYTTQTVVGEGKIVAQTKILNTRRTKKIVLKTSSGIVALKDKEAEKAEITFKDKIKDAVEAPVKEGDVIGNREYFVNGVSVGSVKLVADKDYNFDPITFLVNKMVAFFTSPWLFVGIIILIFVLRTLSIRRKRIRRKIRNAKRRSRNKELENLMNK